jgi:hydroxyacylglutathione hydrolase
MREQEGREDGMNVRQFRYGRDNLGYLLYGDSEAVAVDGGAVGDILAFLREHGLTLRYVTNTHSHGDHTCGNRELLRATGAGFLDAAALRRTGAVGLEGETIRVIETPGHTADSVCFLADGILLSGDTLFMGKVGRCFSGDVRGFYEAVGKLSALPDETLVYAGHDYVEEYLDFAAGLEPGNLAIGPYRAGYNPAAVAASLGDERLVDPFLRLDEPSIVSALQERGLPAGSRYERWCSLISMM